MDIATHDERAIKAWPILVKASVERKPITYKQLAGKLNIHWRPTKHLLMLIQQYCTDHHLPHLTAIVVNQTSRLPGPGCTISAEDLPMEYEKMASWHWTDPPKTFIP